jgi:serine/threonine-protein kinase
MVDFDDNPSPRVGLEDEAQFETSLAPTTDLAHLPAAEIIESGEDASGSSVIRKPNWIGKRFARFKLLRQLGEGSMGRVILAEDVNLHRVIALKVLRKRIKGMDDGQAVQQFLREARGAATIDHPNVVKIFEINEHDGWWYIAMELVEGQTLQQVVRAAGPLSPARACVIIGDAATALEVAHEHGIIHRDVKPSNLMITRQGRCKLTDFGLVRLDSPADPFELHDKSVGTPKFMSPEVIQRRPQGPALDIYSLGATFYFALTGRPPYVGEKVSHILKQHTEAPPPDLRAVLPNCPQSLAALLSRMMAKDPAQRPSAGDVAAALSSEVIAFRQDGSGWTNPGGSGVGQTSGFGLGGSTISLPEQVRTEVAHLRRGRRVRTWIIAILLLGALGYAGWYLLIGRQPADPVFNPAALERLFPEAPQTYGELPPGQLPRPIDPLRSTPTSSWRGKFDDNETHFVANKRGRYYYPIDHPDAVLIPFNQVDGYRTEEEARAAGKLPNPVHATP